MNNKCQCAHTIIAGEQTIVRCVTCPIHGDTEFLKPKHPWPCKHARHFTDWVPTPFGSGNCAMPGFECDYDGDKTTADPCNEDDTCAAYEPLEAAYCNKHAQPVKHVAGEPCWQCEDEAEAVRDELEAAVLGRNDEGR